MNSDTPRPYGSTEQISLQDFQQARATSFQVQSRDASPLALVLKEIAVARSSAQRSDGHPIPAYENFSLVFEGPAEHPLPQRTYRLEHAHLGAFDLFIVPVAREHDYLRYEALFNRRIAGR